MVRGPFRVDDPPPAADPDDDELRLPVEEAWPATQGRIEFDAQPVAEPHRQDRAFVVAFVVVGLLVAAVIKPWDLAPHRTTLRAAVPPGIVDPSPGLARSSFQPTDDPPSDPDYVVPPAPDGERTPLPPRKAILAALRPHDSWGVRLILEQAPAGSAATADRVPVVERWQPALPPLSGPGSLAHNVSDAVVFEVGELVPRLIGLTAPDRVSIDRARVYLTRPFGRSIPISVASIPDRQGQLSLVAPIASDGRVGPWPPGTYQMTVAVGEATTSITVVVVGPPD